MESVVCERAEHVSCIHLNRAACDARPQEKKRASGGGTEREREMGRFIESTSVAVIGAKCDAIWSTASEQNESPTMAANVERSRHGTDGCVRPNFVRGVWR